MAIQNFLSGGFYGKLGDVVGQRWHNKRIIRTYVIPFNPRTELQQSNRAQFALATALAQQAYNINKGSPLWDTAAMGQFSQMVSTAKRRLQAGKSPAEALPLYPDGYVTNIVLTSPSANWSSWGSHVTISDNSYIFTEERTFSVELHCKDELVGGSVFVPRTVTIPAGSQFTFSFSSSNHYSIPEGSSIQAVTTDDASHSGISISLPVFPITQTSKPNIAVNITLKTAERDPLAPAIEFFWNTGGYMPFFEIQQSVYYYNVDAKKWSTHTIWMESNNDGTSRSQVEVDQEFSYPPGSYIVGETRSIGLPTAFISFYWYRYDFSIP